MSVSALNAFDPRDFDGAGIGLGHAAGAQLPAGAGRSLPERVKEVFDKVDEVVPVANAASLQTMVEVTDPGNGGAIPVTGSAFVALVTGGTGQTRTVADPARVGLRLTLFFLTKGGGNCVITFASPVNKAGNNTLTHDTAGEVVHFESVRDGTTSYAWRVTSNEAATPLTTV